MRYYFNLYSEFDVLDEQGVELPDLAAAIQEAHVAAGQMIAEHVANRLPLRLHHRIDIVDETGHIAFTLRCGDLIEEGRAVLPPIS